MSLRVSESGIMRRIMVALSASPACRVFRNNVGMGWVGQSKRFEKAETIKVFPGDVIVRKARPLHAGLFNGSADLIGRTTVTVTPDMVGTRLAIFTSVEVKTDEGTEDPDQVQWREATKSSGGIAIVARSEQEALDGVALALRESQQRKI